MTINKAGLQDTAGLTKIISSSLSYVVSVADLKQRIKKILQRSDHLLLVAIENSQLIGFCHDYLRLFTEVQEAIEISGLAVTEEPLLILWHISPSPNT